MKSFRSLLAVVSIVVIGMTSCSKTGDTGPAGPVGPAGPDSVYSSAWITLNFPGAVNNSGDSVYEETITAASITRAILDSGIVLSYINLGGPGDYFVKDVSSFPQYFYEDFSVGSIYITSFDLNLSGTPFRYVSIPGKLVSGNSTNKKYKGYTVTELKAMPYEQVQQIIADHN